MHRGRGKAGSFIGCAAYPWLESGSKALHICISINSKFQRKEVRRHNVALSNNLVWIIAGTSDRWINIEPPINSWIVILVLD